MLNKLGKSPCWGCKCGIGGRPDDNCSDLGIEAVPVSVSFLFMIELILNAVSVLALSSVAGFMSFGGAQSRHKPPEVT